MTRRLPNVAKEQGAEVPFMRPAELAADTSSEWLAWQHAARWQQEQFPELSGFVSVPATSPLRDPQDIQNAITTLKDGYDLVLGVTESQHHPSFNMVKKIENDAVEIMLPPEKTVTRRQDVPAALNITTVVYATSVSHVLSAKGVLDGNIGSIMIPPERAADIDTLIDFQWIEFLMDQP